MTMKRTLVNVGIIIVLALVGYYCYDTGKSYKILLENLPYIAEDGREQAAIEALNATVDTQINPIFMLEGDRTVATAVGKTHVLKIEILDIEDKVIDTKSIRFTMRDLGSPPTLNVVRAYYEETL
jgi:hypothetical protein